MAYSVDKIAENWSSQRISTLIMDMFVNTADENYIVSRWAIKNGLEIDFYWSGMHAVEKYLKAVLMFNNISAKGFGHNISDLYRRFLMLDPRIKIDTRKYPRWIPEDAPERFEQAEKFIQRLAKYGTPSIRYFEVGYNIQFVDLFKLDNLVWQLRRHCCDFTKIQPADTSVNSSSNIEAIYADDAYMPVHGKLEELLNSNESGAKQALLESNYAFDPFGAEHTQMYAAGRSSMLQWTIGDLGRGEVDPVKKKGARKTLRWVLEFMPIDQEDRKKINSALS